MSSEAPIRGMWVVESDHQLTPDLVQLAKDGLEKAAADGKQVIIVQGVTFRWRPVEVEVSMDADRLADAFTAAMGEAQGIPPAALRVEYNTGRIHGREEGRREARVIPSIPNPALELLRDVVQHWDAGDIDHDYDAISSAIDSAREFVQRNGGLSGEHRHPSGGIPLIDVELLLEAWISHMKRYHPDDDYDDPTYECAEHTAAEYTRLASESSPVEEGAE